MNLDLIRQKLDETLNKQELDKYEIIAGGLRQLADIIQKEGPSSDRNKRIAWRKSLDFIANDL